MNFQELIDHDVFHETGNEKAFVDCHCRMLTHRLMLSRPGRNTASRTKLKIGEMSGIAETRSAGSLGTSHESVSFPSGSSHDKENCRCV